jgi:outer membrane protein
MKTLIAAAFVCASAALAVPAQAQENEATSPWFVRVGAVELQNLHGLNATLAGQPLPGAALNYHHVYTAMVEVGYTFMPDWSAVASIGLPPALSAYGYGSLNGLGKIVSTTLGPSALTIQYQPFHDGMFRPYVGAGMADALVFSRHDAALKNAKLTSDVSPEIEAGMDIMFQENLGMFVEVKKAWLSTHATGTFNGLPFNGTASYAPWVYGTGVTLHF